ncbi:EAL domain-containing protein [Hyphomicrobium sp. xq]|uniref:EAL domain-containing protein n=1 Tax=Hyphomicrobium album TaxID=2665159 RepID=A0A6I3KNR1_9HYPH|nr:EAL domain-containing protein [Hyphomicrobium album]MTD96119.1 EAL domain-containing protein [Hyphomicrobium album]
MTSELDFGCQGCTGAHLDLDISMAFQPIVDVADRSVFAHEALVRGIDGAPAADMLRRVNDENRYAFDQLCRVRAVEMAAALGMTSMLSINFMPNAVYEPSRCLRTTLEAALRTGFPVERIIFETTEDERVEDAAYLKQIFATYRAQGFKTAIDDFGAGYAGLNLLADFQPDIVKIDMALIRGIDRDRARQTIVGALAAVGQLLGIRVIAEGVEEAREALVLRHLGITLMQGYLFARPAFEALPPVDFDALDRLLEARIEAA